MPVELTLKIIDALIARGFDAAKWAQNRAAVKAQLEQWHASKATDDEKLPAIDALVAQIDANSAVIQAGMQKPPADPDQ